MTSHAIADRRLRNQRLTAGGLARPDEVVAWFGAVQAQEFEAALWALGLRLRRAAALADIELAFNEGQLLRTHMMRATRRIGVCGLQRARVGKRFTYALLDERVPVAAPIRREEAAAALALRFLQSHGPATVRDFMWWSGLPRADVRRSFESIGARRREVHGLDYWTAGQLARSTQRAHPTHLLPIYDEYMVAYRDRIAVPHGRAVMANPRDSVIFQHAVVMNGQIAGTWRLNGRGAEPPVVSTTLRRLTADERRSVADATDRYHAFKFRRT